MTTAAQNMRVLLRKSPLCRKHFFEWLKTTVLLFDCGTSTLKSLLLLGSNAPHVHLRLRKRFSRCTLDCGFKTSESPALRGFVAERGPVRGPSLYLYQNRTASTVQKSGLKSSTFRPKPFPHISSKSYRHNAVPNHFSSQFSTSRTNGPRLLSRVKAGTHGFSEKDRTQGHTRRNTGRFGRGWYLYPQTVLRVSETLRGQVSERRTLPLWDLGREVLSKNAESLRDSDALMRVAVPRRRGPAGLRNAAVLASICFEEVTSGGGGDR